MTEHTFWKGIWVQLTRREEELKIWEQQFGVERREMQEHMEALVRLVKIPIEMPGGSKTPMGLSVKLVTLTKKDALRCI